MKSSLFVVMLAIAASASADEPGRAPSEALQIVRAAHFTEARDVTSKDITSTVKSELRGSSGAMAAIGAGTAAGVFSPPAGLSSGASAGLSVIGAFTSGLPVGHPEVSARVIGWMPKAMAATPEEARAVMSTILVNAIKETMPGVAAELVLTPPKSRAQNHVSFAKSGCVNCRIFVKAFEEYVKPKVEKTPALLGGEGEAWAWGHPNRRGDGDGLLTGYPWMEESLTPNERQAFLKALSARLPRWVYLYVPPDARLAPYPQVFHQDRVLLFIEPGVETPTLVNSEQPAS